MYIKSQNERNFSESIYSSQFEKMDFTITKNIDKDSDLYGFIFYDTEGLYAFDYEKEIFYVKHKKGVMKVGYPEGEYDRFGFLKIESFGMDMPVLLKNEEINSLLTYVSEQEKEAALLLDEFENTEKLEVRKKTGERYRKKIAFVDKIKRILEVSEEQEFSFLPTEEEVQIEREEEDERKRIKRNQISVEHIDATLNNKVLFVHEGGTFFYELYSDMIEKIGYQLIKTIEDRHLFLKNVKGIIDTTYEPDIILLNLNEIEGALELIKEIRKLSESVKIVVMDTFFTEKTVKEYLKSGANQFIMKPTYYDGMKEIFDKVLGKEK